MKSTKLLFAQLYVCALAIGTAFAVYNGIISKARQSGMVIITVVLAFIFVSILFVGGVGVLGALLTHVAKSKRELALRLASGATPAAIVKTVIVEWVLRTALLPAALGLLTAYAALTVFDTEIEKVLGFPAQMNFGIFIISLCGIILFCLLVAAYPAFKAARTNITQALAA